MVAMQKKRGGSSRSALIQLSIPFVFGIFMGSLFTAQWMGVSDLSGTDSISLASSLSGFAGDENWETPILPVMQSTTQGWHPIYVYYGKRDDKLSASAPMQMKQNYQPGSQVDQDKVVNALISDYRKANNAAPAPYFIDLAANDAVQLSNTLLLESHGWEGLCLEPNPIYWYRLSHRKCAISGSFVGGKTDLLEVDVSLNNEEYGGIIGEGMDNSIGENKHDQVIHEKQKQTSEKRYTVSLRTVFHQFNVPRVIDYMSLDVEGAEELVMNDFPWDTYTIHLMTVERPKPPVQKLLKDHGYVFVMNLIYWGETLWAHQSFLEHMELEEVKKKVHSVTDKPKKQAKKGQLIFVTETGEYKKKE